MKNLVNGSLTITSKENILKDFESKEGWTVYISFKNKCFFSIMIYA